MSPYNEFYYDDAAALCYKHDNCKWAAPSPQKYPLTIAFLVQHEMREMFLDRAKKLQDRVNRVYKALAA